MTTLIPKGAPQIQKVPPGIFSLSEYNIHFTAGGQSVHNNENC